MEGATIVGDKAPTIATDHPSSLETRLSLRYVAARVAIVTAFGFNIFGPVDLYNASESLNKYIHNINTFSKLKIGWDIAVYICSGLLLAAVYHISIQRLTSTANGVKSPLQRSKFLRYICITSLGIWTIRDVTVRDIFELMGYELDEGIGLLGALFHVCGTMACIFNIGRFWYHIITKAYEPVIQRAVSRQAQEKA